MLFHAVHKRFQVVIPCNMFGVTYYEATVAFSKLLCHNGAEEGGGKKLWKDRTLEAREKRSFLEVILI